MTLTLGSRGSTLARTQSEYVAKLIEEACPDTKVRIEILSTKGDRILDKPLAEIGGKGLFTLELENALRDGSIDLAVHSLKDLPTDPPDGLVIAATPKRATPNDALVCFKWKRLDELPDGARVGTSSLRRRAQLLAIRPNLEIVDLRGNVDTRIEKVRAGELDAAILACAGLERIGRTDAIAEVLGQETLLSAAGQGALGIQTRADHEEVLNILALLNHEDTFYETTAERTTLAALGGGCQVPIGALAHAEAGRMQLDACVCSLDGKITYRACTTGYASDAEELGAHVAKDLIEQGAEAVIADIVG